MKHWRRKGTRTAEASGFALELTDLSGHIASGAPNAALLAAPGSAAEWAVRYNGGAYGVTGGLTSPTSWPYAGNIVDYTGHDGETLQMRVNIDSGAIVVQSNIIQLP